MYSLVEHYRTTAHNLSHMHAKYPLCTISKNLNTDKFTRLTCLNVPRLVAEPLVSSSDTFFFLGEASLSSWFVANFRFVFNRLAALSLLIKIKENRLYTRFTFLNFFFFYKNAGVHKYSIIVHFAYN